MNSLTDWFRANGLAFNEIKTRAETETITFGLRALDDEESTDGVKFLGILLDTLKFDRNVDQLATRLSKNIFPPKNLKKVYPKSCLVQPFRMAYSNLWRITKSGHGDTWHTLREYIHYKEEHLNRVLHRCRSTSRSQ